jgi:hypothetical protein
MKKIIYLCSLLLCAGFANASLITNVTETIDVGTQDSNFAGNVRGFWFTAPVNFWIVGIDVPTDASTANFDTSILRFSSPPALWSSTTTDFDILHEARDQSSAILGLAIEVFAGDIIGVLGNRGGINSYGTAPYPSSILGNAISLGRLGTQNAIGGTTTVAGMGLWQEPGSYISRVNLTISNSVSAVPAPATLSIFALGLSGLLLLRRKKLAA